MIGYFVIFPISLFICRRAKSAGLVSGKTVAWALSPTVGLIGMAVSATYLFGVWPTPAEIEQSRQAQAATDDNQRQALAVNQCANGEMNAWNGQNPNVSQQERIAKLLDIVKECRAPLRQ